MSSVISRKPNGLYSRLLFPGLLFVAATANSVPHGRPTLTSAAEKPAAEHASKAESVKIQVASWKDVQKRVAGHKGHIVVVDAWSTSCPPCLKELPNFVALHKKHHADGVRCISFNCDYDNPKQKPEQVQEPVLKVLTKNGATCENVLSNVPLEDWLTSVDLASIPAVFVYGRDGKLAKRFDNDTLKQGEAEFTYANVTAFVEKLLQEPATKQ